MAINKWMNQLKKLEGALVDRVDPFARDNLLRSSSPSTNWVFGKTHGLPFGMGCLLWGEQKAGKSLLCFDLIGQMHRDYPDYIAVKFDTEFRDEGQLTEEMAALYGIDMDRYLCVQVNEPAQVYDAIEQKIGAMVTAGAPIKLVVIDSITGVRGRRDKDSDTVDQHQIGDQAQTTKVGLKRILSVQKRNRIALIATAHATAEMDMWEQKRGNKTKAAASFGALHHFEYFLNVFKNKTAAGQADIMERKLVDESKKGLDDKGEKTGHKVSVWMQDSTMGPKDRVGEFTIDYQRGIVSQHEEVFKIGLNWGAIKRPTMQTYAIGAEKFTGKPAVIAALEASKELQARVMEDILAMEKMTRQPGKVLATEDPDVAAAFGDTEQVA